MNCELKDCFYNILGRNVISVSGAEACDFLQSLVTNDMKEVSESKTIYACLLSPQGKYNFDFFISYTNNQYIVDVKADQAENLIKKLNLYKLRKKIDIRLEPDYIILSLYNNNAINKNDPLGHTISYLSGVAYIDPRSYLMQYRAVILNKDFKIIKTKLKEGESYDLLRINSIIPEGGADLIIDKSFPLEFGLDKINAISFNKGCYIGQEVTSRSKYRGVIRKIIHKVIADFELNAQDEIYIGENKIGYVTSAINNIGIALIRQEEYNNLSINADSFAVINNHKIKLI